MNALAHCAEAYYHPSRTPAAERHADTGATAIAHALPLVVARPRRDLREDAPARGRDAGCARARGVGALPRARDGAGARRALRAPAGLDERRLPPGGAPLQRGRRAGGGRPVRARRSAPRIAPARVEELARLGGFDRLRDLGVPEAELDEVAEAVVARPGARANPRPATRETSPSCFARSGERSREALPLVAAVAPPREREEDGTPRRQRGDVVERDGVVAGRDRSRGPPSSCASAGAGRRRRRRAGLLVGRIQRNPPTARGGRARFATGSAARGGSQ